jgi:hypothetical protein
MIIKAASEEALSVVLLKQDCCAMFTVNSLFNGYRSGIRFTSLELRRKFAPIGGV